MKTRQSALLALFFGSLGLAVLSGCSAGNPNMSAAESAMEQSDYDRALANVDTVITQDSANVEAYMMKAKILRQMADSTTPPSEYKELYQQARDAEQQAIEFDPSQRSAVNEQRELAYIQEFQKGAEAFNSAQQSGSQEQYLRAAAFFGAAGAIQPDSTGPIRNEAFARLRAARLEEGDKVVQEMNKVIPILEDYLEKEDEPSKNVYTILAQLYLQAEEPEQAIQLTEQAIDDLSNRPTYFRLYGTQGINYTGTITVDGSSRSVEGTTPKRVQVSSSGGMVSGSFQKTEGGRRQAKGRLRVGLYLEGTEVASGRTTSIGDTVAISQDLSSVAPLAELQNYRLNALNQIGDTERAMSAYQQQIEKNPNDATYRYNYGSLLLNADRYDDAAEQLQKAVELDPNDPKKHYNLGAAYLNKGVALQDSLVSLRDSVLAKDRNPTEEERQQIKALDDQRLEYFNNAIPPLEQAREMSGADGRYRQSACSALFQAYVQTEQMEKAQGVKECAGQSMSGSNGGGNR